MPRSRPWKDRSENARRFAAARILKGWDRAELDQALEEAEVGSDMTYRLENDRTPLPGPRRDAIAKVLGIPAEWFTADLESLLWSVAQEKQPATEAVIAGLRQAMSEEFRRLLTPEALDDLAQQADEGEPGDEPESDEPESQVEP